MRLPRRSRVGHPYPLYGTEAKETPGVPACHAARHSDREPGRTACSDDGPDISSRHSIPTRGSCRGLERRPKDWDLEGIDRPEFDFKCLDDAKTVTLYGNRPQPLVARVRSGAIVECKDRLCSLSPMVSVGLLNSRVADRGFFTNRQMLVLGGRRKVSRRCHQRRVPAVRGTWDA
jgi:hypothetical protein